MKKIYLASPYGFSEQQKRLLLPELVSALEGLGLEVWEPFQRNNQVDFSRPGWAYEVGQADLRDVRGADAVFAVVNGLPDEGVCVELGVAIALGKPTFLFRDDFRRMTDSQDVSPEPDALHRHAGGLLAGLLPHVGVGDSREGPGPLGPGLIRGILWACPRLSGVFFGLVPVSPGSALLVSSLLANISVHPRLSGVCSRSAGSALRPCPPLPSKEVHPRSSGVRIVSCH